MIPLVLLGAPAPASAADPLQPGDFVSTHAGACTLGFVFDGTGAYAGRVYISTAAHCVWRVGDYVRDEDGATFGRVAVLGTGSVTARDYAFIEVLRSHVSRVRAAVKGFSAAPTGYTTSTGTAFGDTVRISGYGLGYHLLPTTRERRAGVLTTDNTSEYELVGMDTFGDSGGPIVHERTRRALGLVSRACVVGACTSEGPTVQGILSLARARGFTVRLRTIFG